MTHSLFTSSVRCFFYSSKFKGEFFVAGFNYQSLLIFKRETSSLFSKIMNMETRKTKFVYKAAIAGLNKDLVRQKLIKYFENN